MILKQKELVKVGGKVIGYIDGETFIKPVYASKHKLRQPPAWAIDADAFEEVIRPQVSQILIIDREDCGARYRVSVETFGRYAFEINRGHGRQYALPIGFFQVEENDDRQLSLWGNNE